MARAYYRHDPKVLARIIELRQTIKSPTKIAQEVGLRVTQVEGILRNMRRYIDILPKEGIEENKPDEPRAGLAQELGIEIVSWRVRKNTASQSSSESLPVFVSLPRVRCLELDPGE